MNFIQYINISQKSQYIEYRDIIIIEGLILTIYHIVRYSYRPNPIANATPRKLWVIAIIFPSVHLSVHTWSHDDMNHAYSTLRRHRLGYKAVLVYCISLLPGRNDLTPFFIFINQWKDGFLQTAEIYAPFCHRHFDVCISLFFAEGV